jgi:hypothetical protein
MPTKITATVVKEEARNSFMFDHFGPAFMFVENGIYTTLDKICPDYKGGYWQFVELSNGGGYMCLDTNQPTWPACLNLPYHNSRNFYTIARRWGSLISLHLACENYYEGDVSPDAASIVACLYAINKAVWARPDDENLYKHYYWLSDFASQHVEAESIFSAID